jgi:hypothetical protein
MFTCPAFGRVKPRSELLCEQETSYSGMSRACLASLLACLALTLKLY